MTATATEAQPEARTIFQLFAEAKRKVGPVGKDSRNQQQNFNYRGVDAVVNAIAAAFDELGIIPVPMLKRYEYREGVEIGKARSLMGHVQVEVGYRFYGPLGDSFDAEVPGEAMDSGDKATAKAMSVAYRICLLQTLNLPTSDPDPDSQSYQRSDARSGSRNGADFDTATPAPPRNNGHRQQDGPPAPPPLDPGDSWAQLIADIKTIEDADAAEAELKRAWEAKEIDDQRTHQVKHWIRVKAAPMRTAAQSAPRGDQQPSEPADGEHFAELAIELASTPLGGIQAFRGKIGRYIAERKITPEEGAALSADAIKRKRQLEEAAEAGQPVPA